jgi:hypothetical protein
MNTWQISECPVALYSGYWLSLPGVKLLGLGVALITHCLLTPRLMKEQSYTSTTPVVLHGFF